MRGDGPGLAAVGYTPPGDVERFPFHVPTVATLDRLEFTAPVTWLVGENGSGKSTFLEALALATGLPGVGSERPSTDPTLAAQRELAACFRLAWRGARTHRGFFLRAEDFFGFQKAIVRSRSEHEAEIRRVDREMADASDWARGLAQGPHRASLGDMARRYGDDPDAASHGEAFLRLFGSRLVPAGLYLLDEPEAALSPRSQLAFMAMILDAVAGGSQFVIATHAPILMATPDSEILSFDEAPVARVAWEELDAVRITRDFLNAPERYLRHFEK